ncbi:AIPR family protein [Candidatus Thiodiazotropha endoloripes]|uniref:AIPR family protein n=1 Tax=Candidatus Thiodiazotropha endoloripes TaxID=1818881 RepID=UPI0013904850|nr:AIPR family protein [Candidatus Thiodiazotropha endoloripes]
MSSFILRIKDAQSQNGKVSKLTGNATLSTFADLITHSDLDANPRTAKKNQVADDIVATLHETPELFQFMSKGILFAARGVRPLERSRFQIQVANPKKEGVLDGGHNTFAIGRYILEHTGYDKVREVRDWGDLKKHWSEHLTEIEKQRTELPEILIPIEIVHPADAPSGEQDFEDSVLPISAARNNNAQLKETAKANKAGLYDELKVNMDPAIRDDVEWKENDGGRLKAADLVSLALIPLSALPAGKYPVAKQLKDAPSVLFSSKGQCVKLYNDFMKQKGVTQQVTGDRIVEVVDPMVKSALALINDLPRLHDLIYTRLPDAYNKASPGFGRINSVRTLDPAKWKSDKKSYMRHPAKTKYYQHNVNWSYPDGFMYPLVVSLAELVEVDGDEVRWSKDPDEFIRQKLSVVLKSGYQAIIRGQEYDPAKVGKEKGSYELVQNMYRVVEHL